LQLSNIATETRESLLKVDKEKIGPCEYALTIEVEPERLQQPLRQAARRLSRRRPLPGFRPGKAPYHMVERTYGKELIFDEMLANLGNALYQEALEQGQLEPYARAEFEIVELEPLILKITVPAQPEITLGDYHTINVAQSPVAVSEEEVAEVLADIQDEQALWVPVERATKMGDQVLLDAVGTSDDGHKVEQNSLTLEVSEEIVPAGFGQNLVGIKPGETKEFDAEYPADFQDEDMAGKTVHFHATVKAVKEKELPALDDELAQSLGRHKTLDELRADIREKLRVRKETEAEDAAIEESLRALVEQATVEYPAIAVEHELNTMQQALAGRLEQRGFTMDGYLHTTGKTVAQWREETRPQAETRLERALVLSKFAEAEGIKVEEEETRQELDRLSSSFGERADDVKAALSTGESLLSIANEVYRRKALEHLLGIATGKAKPRATPPEGERTAADGGEEIMPQDDKSNVEQSTENTDS
jgi:trigger factor